MLMLSQATYYAFSRQCSAHAREYHFALLNRRNINCIRNFTETKLIVFLLSKNSSFYSVRLFDLFV